MTSGGQLLVSAGELRAAGAEITDAVCVIDREEGGTEALAAEGLTLHPLLRRADLDRTTTAAG